MTYTVAKQQTGEWSVCRNGEPVTIHTTHAAAWRELDRLERDPVSRAENLGQWISEQIIGPPGGALVTKQRGEG